MELGTSRRETIQEHPSAIRILCRCKKTVVVAKETEVFACECGAVLGRRVDGVAVVTEATPYWGEISQQHMREIIDASSRVHWREALNEILPVEEQERITNRGRAAFRDVLPLPPGSRVLDIGAGLGVIATELAEEHYVTALEGVWERARFIQIRREHDRIEKLTVLNGDLNSVQFAEGQFDAIILNGVLEWAGLFDLSLPPDQVQIRFLAHLRRLLRDGGIIYIGIENRIGWPMFLGRLDHNDLKYTSLMPRWLASWYSRRFEHPRTATGHGYRTYTYSYSGYRKLFDKAGLQVRTAYMPMPGYTLPTEMVPFHRAAVERYVSAHWVQMGPGREWKNRIKRALGKEWFFRAFAPDYSFIVEKKP